MSRDLTGARRAELARAAADAAKAITGVARLDGGAFGEFATYADGERVEGVRIGHEDPSTVRLRLIVAYGRSIPQIAADVDAAVRDRLGPEWRSTRVDIDVVGIDGRVSDSFDKGSIHSDSKG